jgi:hexulose-6-phosphate isomerase
LDYIEWIYDEYGHAANPLTNEEGITELNAFKEQYGIATPAICADWLMDFPLVRCSEQECSQRTMVLHRLFHWGQRIGATRLVLPFVDASSMRTEEEKHDVLRVLEHTLPLAEETGIEIHLEADLCPDDFARFLVAIPHPMVKVNYDTGNSSGLGYVAREEFAAYGARIGSVHIKDRLRKPDGGVATMPLGQGSADFEDVFSSIRSINYRGSFTLQAARGVAGDEVSWLRQQIAFVRSHWD